MTVGTGKAVGEDLSGELVPSHSYAVVGQFGFIRRLRFLGLGEG